MTRPVLFEINARCWLAELTTRAGRTLTLADVPEAELVEWKKRGFTHIWLMGVWTIGGRGLAWSRKCYGGREHEFGCAEIVGSPYAIQSYDVSSRLGGDAALAVFHQRLRAHGLKLVLDFVPNHVALDHPWVRSQPDYLVTSERRRRGATKPFRGSSRWYAHGDCGHGSPWVDTLQLEYRNPELRSAMLQELLRISSQCDGVRCDMAMLVINDVFAATWREWEHAFGAPTSEFWADAIAAIKQGRPEFIFLAEVYWNLEERLQKLGFDFTYDKGLYDRLVAHDSAGAAKHVRSQPLEYVARSAYFIENHDEQRVASLLTPEEHRAAAFLISVLPGMPFYHEGQFGGARVHANVHFGRRGEEKSDAELERWYEMLFAVLGQSSVGRGVPAILEPRPGWEGNPSHASFVVVQWQAGLAEFDLAIVNLASHRGQCFAPVLLGNGGQGTWRLWDRLGSEIHLRSNQDLSQRGLFLDVPAHGMHLFHFSLEQAGAG